MAAEQNLDLSRVIFSGHSAGGHLALWLVARHKLGASSELYFENSLPLKGAVALAPAADLSLNYNQAVDFGAEDFCTCCEVFVNACPPDLLANFSVSATPVR